VFGMLADKDIAGVVQKLKSHVDMWFVADLPGPRGARADALAAIIATEQPWAEVRRFTSPAEALAAARAEAGTDDRITVFGSFLTVADVMSQRKSGSGRQ